jgi:phage-related protein
LPGHTHIGINEFMAEKPLRWMGASHKDLKDFPEMVRKDAGYAIGLLQNGVVPDNVKHWAGAAEQASWKSLKTSTPTRTER